MVNSNDFNLLNQFLAMDTYNQDKKYDLILVLGNAIAQSALMAYQLYKDGHSHYFMIAGGRGHTTDILENSIKEVYSLKNIHQQSEAKLFRYIIEAKYGFDDSIILEERSTNCGENIQFAFQILKEKNIDVKDVLLVHDPLMQRRIDATARYHRPDISFDNYRCFLPKVEYSNSVLEIKNEIWGLWSNERYISLLLGEMKRVIDNKEGYGPLGKNYICHVNVPDDILAAYHRILYKYSNYQRK